MEINTLIQHLLEAKDEADDTTVYASTSSPDGDFDVVGIDRVEVVDAGASGTHIVLVREGD